MPFENRHLAGEGDQIVPNRETELIRPQAMQLYLIERRQGIAAFPGARFAASGPHLPHWRRNGHEPSVR